MAINRPAKLLDLRRADTCRDRRRVLHESDGARGAEGERRLAAILARGTAKDTVVLHDRRMPLGRGTVDHLAISIAGVFVIDAKRYARAAVRVARRGGIVRERTEHLEIGGRDESSLLDGVLRQAAAVDAVLATLPPPCPPVHPMLVFVDGDLPWRGPLTARGVTICSPGRAVKLIGADGAVFGADARRIVRQLDKALPPAR